jgi:hypothetical protein
MKAAMSLGALVLLLVSAQAMGQSERFGGRISDRVGGRINEGTAVQPRGLYGPDPYVGPGSVSPFSQSPVVPLRSAPLASSPNPYTSRYPSTQTPLAPERQIDQPTMLGPADLAPSDAKQEGQAVQPRAARSSDKEHRIGDKLGEGGLTPDQTEHAPKAPAEIARRPLTAKKANEAPCLNGRARAANGDCTGRLRPK